MPLAVWSTGNERLLSEVPSNCKSPVVVFSAGKISEVSEAEAIPNEFAVVRLERLTELTLSLLNIEKSPSRFNRGNETLVRSVLVLILKANAPVVRCSVN